MARLSLTASYSTGPSGRLCRYSHPRFLTMVVLERRKEPPLLLAMLRGKVRVHGSLRLLDRFGKCFE